MKSSERFWKQLSNYISLTCKEDNALPENCTERDVFNLSYRYQCQSAILEIIAYDVFLEKKLLHAEPLAKQASEIRNRVDNSVSIEKSTAVTRCDHKDILSVWSQSSVLGNLLKLLTSYDHDNESYFHAKVTFSGMSFAFNLVTCFVCFAFSFSLFNVQCCSILQITVVFFLHHWIIYLLFFVLVLFDYVKI